MNEIRKNFCPLCGKEVEMEEMISGMCAECYIKKEKIIEPPRDSKITICPRCGSLYEGGWKKSKSIESAAVAFISSKILISNEIDDVELNLSPERLNSKRVLVHGCLKGKVKGEVIEKKMDILVHVAYNICDRCSRISGRYYESIVQIRAYERNPTKLEIEEIEKIANEIVNNGYDRGDEKSFITDIKEFEKGLDLYLGSKKIAKQICRSVRSRYGGDLVDSAKLVGEKDGKKNYRVTHSLRLPKFLRGDIISYEGNIVQIRTIGTKIMGRNLSNGKTIMLASHKDKLKWIKKVGSIKEAAETDLITVVGKEIQVLDPETDEVVTISKPYFIDDLSEKNKVKVIKMDSGLIAVLPHKNDI